VSQPAQKYSSAPAVQVPPPSRPIDDQHGKIRSAENAQNNPVVSLPFQGPVRWVYNDDHTDSLNFGYMFPVPTGTHPTYTSPPSNPGVGTFNVSPSPVTEQWAPAGASPSSSGSSYESAGNHASLSFRVPPGPDIGLNQQWDVHSDGSEYGTQQWNNSQQQASMSLSSQYQTPAQHGYILQNEMPTSMAPVQQFLPVHASERLAPRNPLFPLRQQAKFTRFPIQSSSVPQPLYGSSSAEAYVWPQNEINDFSHSFVGPAQSGPILTTESIASALPLKRKRESEYSTQLLNENSLASSHGFVIDESTQYVQHQHPVLCSRCHLYERVVRQSSSFPFIAPTRSKNASPEPG